MFSACWHILVMGCMEELAAAKTMEKPWKNHGKNHEKWKGLATILALC